MIPLPSRLVPPLALSALALSSALLVAPSASAQSTITRYRDRPSYGVELEPHLTLGWIEPPGIGTGEGIGMGVRGSFEIVGEGFIKPINDSIAIGVGLDWIHYSGDDLSSTGECAESVPGQNGGSVCVEVEDFSYDSSTDYLWFPVVMQWNFWLHRRWSVFGEPGIAIRLDDMDQIALSPFVFWAGGRFHITNDLTLTLRAGIPFVVTPYVSIGLSILL
jgi:hypothetical protein